MDFEKVLSMILEIKSPWYISEMDAHKGTKTQNVFIDFRRGITFMFPNCEKQCKVRDSTYRVWRHLDVMKKNQSSPIF